MKQLLFGKKKSTIEKGEDNKKEIISELKKIYYDYHAEYVRIVNVKYLKQLEENKTAFYLYDINKMSMFVIEDDSNHFDTPKMFIIFYQSEYFSIEDLIINKTSDFKDINPILYTYDYMYINDIFEKYTEGKVQEKHLIENRIDKINEYLSGERYAEFFDYYKYLLSNFISYDFTEYYETLNKSNKVLSKREFDNSYSYTNFDFTEIVNFFRLESLTTLINQSIFCYKHNKYLSAAATLGVCLEEMCMQILIREGREFSWKEDTSLYVLIGQLANMKVIDRRTASRLRASAILRNGASHASTGFITKSDCDTIISSMNHLLDTYKAFLSRK